MTTVRHYPVRAAGGIVRPWTTESNLKYTSPYRALNTLPVTQTSQLMLYREIMAVCSEIHTKHINTVCGQNVELDLKTQSVPRSKHSVWVLQTIQLMLYREIMAVCSEIHTKHINTLCGQNVKPDGR